MKYEVLDLNLMIQEHVEEDIKNENNIVRICMKINSQKYRTWSFTQKFPLATVVIVSDYKPGISSRINTSPLNSKKDYYFSFLGQNNLESGVTYKNPAYGPWTTRDEAFRIISYLNSMLKNPRIISQIQRNSELSPEFIEGVDL